MTLSPQSKDIRFKDLQRKSKNQSKKVNRLKMKDWNLVRTNT